jgi:hypothetical protein
MLCQRLRSCTLIFAHKEDNFIVFIMFISCIVCLGLHCFIICHCLLVFYLFISRFLFGFPIFFVSINIFLQQSICIMFISCIVGFALSCCGCCLFLLYLIISFIIIWVSNFFVSLNNFLQQLTCFLKRDNKL